MTAGRVWLRVVTPVRSLRQCEQASGPNRTNRRNLTQQFRGFRFSAFRQLGTQRSPQTLQSIQPLIQKLGSPAHAHVLDLV